MEHPLAGIGTFDMSTEWDDEVVTPLGELIQHWELREDKLPLHSLRGVWPIPNAGTRPTRDLAIAASRLREIADNCYLPGKERSILRDAADRIENALRPAPQPAT